MPAPYRKIFTEETEEELMNMTRQEVTLHLNDKQRAFCELYVGNYNIKMAAVKAGYTPKSAHVVGWKLRQDPDVNRYLAWLKLQIGKECHIRAIDIIDHYIRIAFSDVTDFVSIKKGKFGGKTIEIEDLDRIDGQLIKRISQNTNGGFSIEMVDKLKALEKLEQYFDVMPKDWKQKIEERKLEIAEQKLEIERMKIGLYDHAEEDDGFIEALLGETTAVWETEVEFESVDDGNEF